MPITRRRVVCTLGETIETLVPTSRLSSVDLPTLGAPMIATNPARWPPAQPCGASPSTLQQLGRRRLLGRPLGGRRSRPGGRCRSARLTSTVKVIACAGPAVATTPIDRAGQATRLRPLLQRRSWHRAAPSARPRSGAPSGARRTPGGREARRRGRWRRSAPRSCRRACAGPAPPRSTSLPAIAQPAAEPERQRDLGQALRADQGAPGGASAAPSGVVGEAARSAGAPRSARAPGRPGTPAARWLRPAAARRAAAAACWHGSAPRRARRVAERVAERRLELAARSRQRAAGAARVS